MRDFTPSSSVSEDGGWFFGVFDGHGKEGDLCAQFVKDKLPGFIVEELKKVKGEVRRSEADVHNARTHARTQGRQGSLLLTNY